MDFLKKLQEAIKKNDSLLCVGLDPDLDKIPEKFKSEQDPIFSFNKYIVDQTADLVCVFKPNIAFYAAYGLPGIEQLKKTIDYVHSKDLPLLLDAKRGDIGSTAQAYVKEVFDELNVDAVTVNPYLGFDALEPFLERKDKGIVILCRTSNPGASDFQDLKVGDEALYLKVAEKVVEWDKKYGNCLMVVGATWPEQLKQIRELAPDMFFLIPGIGAQGGDLENTLKNGLNNKKSGLIISSSRGILYAENPKEEAKKIKEEINSYR